MIIDQLNLIKLGYLLILIALPFVISRLLIFFRSIRMRQLAKELGLEYLRYEKLDQRGALTNINGNKNWNVIRGWYRGHFVEILDKLELFYAFRGNKATHNTVVLIDAQKIYTTNKIIVHMLDHRLSVKNIKDVLNTYIDTGRVKEVFNVNYLLVNIFLVVYIILGMILFFVVF